MLEKYSDDVISVDGIDYFVAGPRMGNFVLVKYADGKGKAREAFCNPSCEEEGFNPKIFPQNFPIGSILCYGNEAAIIARKYPANEGPQTFGLYDMQRQEFVPNETISFSSLLSNGSPFTPYNRELLFTLCDDPNKLLMFFAENGLPKEKDGKAMVFDLANRVINLQKDRALSNLSSALFDEDGLNNGSKSGKQF